MKVLSLFDGISCGMVALERAGIEVEKYDAFEIDKYAIRVSQANYPQIQQHGDVFEGDFTQFQGYDLLIGGSPCQFWSVANKNHEVIPDGEGGKLFMQYVRALEESKCPYFLYENNASIAQSIKDFISSKLGVQPITIDSALLSAQSRKRCYWTNIPNDGLPHDKGIALSSIVPNSYGAATRGRYRADGTTYQKIEIRPDNKANCITTVSKDCMVCYQFMGGGSTIGKKFNVTNGQINDEGKVYKVKLPDGDYILRNFTQTELEQLQTLPLHYTDAVSSSYTRRLIGNGWTVDVIAYLLSNLSELKS